MAMPGYLQVSSSGSLGVIFELQRGLEEPSCRFPCMGDGQRDCTWMELALPSVCSVVGVWDKR